MCVAGCSLSDIAVARPRGIDQLERSCPPSKTLCRKKQPPGHLFGDPSDAAHEVALPSPGLDGEPARRQFNQSVAAFEPDRLFTRLDHLWIGSACEETFDGVQNLLGIHAHQVIVRGHRRVSHCRVKSIFVLQDRLDEVENRIASACQRNGRARREITLVAVTKVFPAGVIQEAHALGLRDFGENYVQEFAGKADTVAGLEGARFHLIGHLQSNKSNKAAELFQIIETVDSAKLAQRLESTGRKLEVMIEVKLSDEEAKYGAAPDELPALVDAIRECPNLHLTGLMTMPPWSDDPEASRPFFRRLRELAAERGLPGLSMGMSHDFEVAIDEGATHIRVGTALFGRRKRP
jgi:PLP dependent protein